MNADTEKEDERIISDPNVCHGYPIIRGTRIMAWLVLEYLASGDAIDDVPTAYPELTREDVLACLAYASRAAKERIMPMEIVPHAR